MLPVAMLIAPPLWATTVVVYLILAGVGFALAEMVYQVRRTRVAPPGG